MRRAPMLASIRNGRSLRPLLPGLLAVLLTHAPAAQSDTPSPGPEPALGAGPGAAEIAPEVRRAVDRGLDALLAMEEDGTSGRWPYEGMIRHEGRIPFPFQLGGTAFAALALAASPDWGEDDVRRAAFDRALGTLLDHLDHPSLSVGTHSTSDPRVWAFLSVSAALVELDGLGRIPEERRAEARRATQILIDRLEDISIPESGGWSYRRPVGLRLPAPAFSYVTASAVLTLLRAREQGYEVDSELLELAVESLEAQRDPSGAFLYSGTGPHAKRQPIPEAAGRMVACELALLRAGRSSLVHVRGALDAFLAHWSALDERRGRAGTHAPPHGIAPFYFYYAHHHAALAVEALPEAERAVYRARLRELLLGLQSEEGTWNDRVFPRSANYGTSVALLALLRPYR